VRYELGSCCKLGKKTVGSYGEKVVVTYGKKTIVSYVEKDVLYSQKRKRERDVL
jgi:hypothetical protein